MLEIRHASESDLYRILEIYSTARTFMRATGNAGQWTGGYPDAELLLRDIGAGNLYVVVYERRIVGTFCFIIGPDPTYAAIDGRWLNHDEYGTIHRLASDGTVKGIADAALAYCKSIIGNIRIDTHSDNCVMRNWIRSRGFSYCGIIHLSDGSPRLAYQLVPVRI